MKFAHSLLALACFVLSLGSAMPGGHCFPCMASLMNEVPPPPDSYFPTEWEEGVTDFTVFPVSSEMQIGKIQPMIQRVPCGLYLTVGGERGFRAASMSDKITALYLLDIHDDIIRYVRINRELLKVPFRQVYLDLRWKSPFSEWQRLFEGVHRLYGQTVDITEDDFKWWEKNIRDLGRDAYVLPEYINRNNSSPPCTNEELSEEERELDLGRVIDYKTGNYLFYDDLYERIHRLAVQNRIYTSKINFLDDNQVAQLIEYLKGTALILSVLDLDNLYFEEYLGQKVYHRLIAHFLPLGKDNSVLLVMKNYKDYACGQFQFYLGFTFDHVDSWSEALRMQDFIDSFPKEAHDLIDGRLFEAGEELPVFGKK